MRYVGKFRRLVVDRLLLSVKTVFQQLMLQATFRPCNKGDG